jgi:hypothetical protein
MQQDAKDILGVECVSSPFVVARPKRSAAVGLVNLVEPIAAYLGEGHGGKTNTSVE